MSGLLQVLLSIYGIVLFARIVLDLIISLTGGRGLSGMAIVYGILYDLTEPVLRPIRRLLPPLRIGAAALDLSPLLVFVAIGILQQLVARL